MEGNIVEDRVVVSSMGCRNLQICQYRVGFRSHMTGEIGGSWERPSKM